MNDTNHARVSVIRREMKSVKNMAKLLLLVCNGANFAQAKAKVKV